jgi:hypothetical protein
VAQSKGIVRNLISLVLLGGTALGLYNVYSDNTEVKTQAERVACAGRECTSSFLRESRSPIAQSFTLQTKLVEKGKVDRSASVDVECKRELVLVGEYRCTARGALP